MHQPMVARHSPGSRRLTLGADKAYDVHGFVDDLRELNVTPHIAQNTTNRTSAIDARTTRHPGYAISQQKGAVVSHSDRRAQRRTKDDNDRGAGAQAAHCVVALGHDRGDTRRR
jgi:hypothetical protein